MKKLTRKEEELMKILWKLEKAFVKDIVEEVIEETGKRIKPVKEDAKGKEELRELVVEALKKTEGKDYLIG